MFLILANFPFRPATTVSGKTRKSDDVIGFRSVSPSQCPAIRQRCAAASGRCAVTWKKEHFLLFNYARHLAGGGSSSGRRWQPKPPNKKEVTLSAFQSGRCVQGRHLTRRNIVHILIVSINWLRHFFFLHVPIDCSIEWMTGLFALMNQSKSFVGSIFGHRRCALSWLFDSARNSVERREKQDISLVRVCIFSREMVVIHHGPAEQREGGNVHHCRATDFYLIQTGREMEKKINEIFILLLCPKWATWKSGQPTIPVPSERPAGRIVSTSSADRPRSLAQEFRDRQLPTSVWWVRCGSVEWPAGPRPWRRLISSVGCHWPTTVKRKCRKCEL